MNSNDINTNKEKVIKESEPIPDENERIEREEWENYSDNDYDDNELEDAKKKEEKKTNTEDNIEIADSSYPHPNYSGKYNNHSYHQDKYQSHYDDDYGYSKKQFNKYEYGYDNFNTNPNFYSKYSAPLSSRGPNPYKYNGFMNSVPAIEVSDPIIKSKSGGTNKTEFQGDFVNLNNNYAQKGSPVKHYQGEYHKKKYYSSNPNHGNFGEFKRNFASQNKEDLPKTDFKNNEISNNEQKLSKPIFFNSKLDKNKNPEGNFVDLEKDHPKYTLANVEDLNKLKSEEKPIPMLYINKYDVGPQYMSSFVPQYNPMNPMNIQSMNVNENPQNKEENNLTNINTSSPPENEANEAYEEDTINNNIHGIEVLEGSRRDYYNSSNYYYKGKGFQNGPRNKRNFGDNNYNYGDNTNYKKNYYIKQPYERRPPFKRRFDGGGNY
ncbi:MAG: hypothetical protein MJ252_09975 [archaeon]|nr:hypothetical protein [archaeon]